jgi:two-component system, NarL family, response regulator DevR
MITVAIVDDHPAVRMGLIALIQREPGFVLALSAGDADEARVKLGKHPVDVVLADFQLPAGDGIALCRALKSERACRAALLYSAFADGRLGIAARVAGLDGVVGKGVAADVLFEGLRQVARGRQRFPEFAAAQMREASTLIDVEDQPMLGMLLGGTREAEVGAVLGLSPGAVGQRVERMVAALKPRAVPG